MQSTFYCIHTNFHTNQASFDLSDFDEFELEKRKRLWKRKKHHLSYLRVDLRNLDCGELQQTYHHVLATIHRHHQRSVKVHQKDYNHQRVRRRAGHAGRGVAAAVVLLESTVDVIKLSSSNALRIVKVGEFGGGKIKAEGY